MSRQRGGSARAVGVVGGLALMLGITTLGGALVGQYLDGRWGTAPWLTLVGTLAGMAAGFAEVVRVARGIGAQE